VADLEGEHREAPDAPFGYRDRIRIMDAWPFSKNVRAIARAPKLLALLRGLYGREPKPFQTLNFAIGTGDDAHSDAMHFNSIPRGFMCAAWIALENIDMDNGPIFYYPGSHRLPEVTTADIGARPYQDDYPIYTEHVKEVIAREGLEIEYATLRKGQALIWAANLLHGGADQRDESRTRLSQVTHYYFEGCRYYTPKQSDRWLTYWRDPRWVT
jgi:ectoine hydroxylase-related dioxygenase (phytanoyl-CoA dioxygenase family)